MSDTGRRRWALAVLLGTALAFVVLHFQLARSARFVPDDLCQRANAAAYGLLGAQRFLYRGWSGRWVSNGLVASVMWVLREPRAAFPFALLLLGGAVATVCVVTLALLRARVRAGVLPLLAVVTVALAFFATPSRGDSWFFVFCALENVVPLCAALLALACVAHAGERSWLVVPGAFLAALATACHESVALAVLASAGCLLAATVLRDARDPRLPAAATVLAIGVLSFAISAASPGSSSRLSGMPRTSVPSALWHAAVDGPGVLADLARAAAAPLLTTLLAWTVAASVFAPVDPRAAAVPLRRVLSVAGAALLLAPVVAFAATLPGYYALGEPPPARALLVLAVFLVVAAVAIGSVAGAALRESGPARGVLVGLLCVALLRVAIVELPRMRADITVAAVYAAAYDARVAQLRALPRVRSSLPIVVPPLPPSGVLRSAEISSEQPRAFANTCLRRMLRLARPLLRAPDPDAQPRD